MLLVTTGVLQRRLRIGWRRWHFLFVVPIVSFLGWYAAGQIGTTITAVVMPLAIAMLAPAPAGRDPVTSTLLREPFLANADRNLIQARRTRSNTAIFVLEVDRFKLLEERNNRSGIETLLRAITTRLALSLRASDAIARLDGPTFAVTLAPAASLDLEAAIQLATRIQHSMAEPIKIDGLNVYCSVSIGFCLSDRIEGVDSSELLQAATNALIEAQRHAPSAIRNYSPAMRSRIANCNELSQQVSRALEKGQIRAFFQPQISTRTGRITGFETLARWQHPQRGLIPPIEFLPALAQVGLMHRLGEVMVNDALSALSRWDAAGLDVPRVGVNFSNDELRDPELVDRISLQLEQFCLSPERLAVEVLETVVADHADDIVIRNLSGLARLGCSLDLDDFGTGHASITSIRRYAVERIKIDRSFVTRIDADQEQQKMVSAILTMAERLGLDTLAEGVETAAEREMLAQLGCGHVQGYGIARPLPPEDVDQWIKGYRAIVINQRPFRRRVG